MKRAPLVLVVLSVALTVLSGGPSSASGDPAAPVGRRPASLRHLSLAGPKQVWVYELPPSGPRALDIASARSRLGGFATTSRMARRNDAVAATNGDFGLANGRPGHLMVTDGQLIQTSPLGDEGKNLFISDQGVSIGHPDLSIQALNSDGSSVSVSGWNGGAPRSNEVAAFTADASSVEDFPTGTCGVTLAPLGDPSFGASGELVSTYRVKEASCLEAAPAGREVSLATRPGSRSYRIFKHWKSASRVTVSTALGVPYAREVLGGSPILVEDGSLAVERCSKYLCHRHSRTGVGVKADGTVLMVVVDGRQADSKGMTLVEFGRFFMRLGAVDALNLDGGGSSTMVSRGRVVNDPSDGVEREVTTALLVVRK